LAAREHGELETRVAGKLRFPREHFSPLIGETAHLMAGRDASLGDGGLAVREIVARETQ
jgi:hypothetical protein